MFKNGIFLVLKMAGEELSEELGQICVSHNSQETYGCAVRISLVEITINHLFKDVLTEIKLLHQKIT